MNGGPSGFNNAPVTRTFMVFCALFTVAFIARGRSAHLGFSHQDVIQRLRFFRVFASIFAFSSLQELMFGLYLLYYFRVFERQIGSNKYSVFVLFSLTSSLFFKVIALAPLKDQTTRILASGPYSLIFASFIPFIFDIPISSQFRIFGIPFSDKTLIYIVGLQLLLSSWKRSLVPAICGLLAGSLYRLNIFGIRRFKFPQFIASFFSPLFSSASQSSRRRPNVRRNLPAYGAYHLERNAPSTNTSSEPPETSVAILVSMGFDSNSARQALLQAGNDINVATNILLEAQTR